MNILITNGQLRKTLTTVRSLGKKGFKVFSSEITKFNPAGFSKYCFKSLKYPHPILKKTEFIKWLFATFNKYKIDLFIPMDDDILECTIDYWPEIKNKVIFIMPEANHYKLAANKSTAIRLAQEADLDCPKTYHLSNDNLDESILEIIKTFKFPLVLKPRKSSGSRGIRVVKSQEELIKTYNEIKTIYPKPLFQEFIPPGTRYDVCLLVNKKSNIIASFVQKELRHFPLSIGPSTVQESVYMPHLIEKCKNLVSKLSWYGIIEIEFMEDHRDNKLKFMEINPRFWNSLNTSIISGVDFPSILAKMAFNMPYTQKHNYEIGVKSRTLIPNDILHFLFNKNRFSLQPAFLSTKKNKIYDDILSAKDFMPLLGFILAVILYLPNPKMWKFFFER